MSEYKTKKRNGFTLIELVVVVSILAIVGVMVIPSLRTLNEDRKVRDTARVVGAVFAAARERAAVDGQSGVEIVSIPAIPDPADPIVSYNLPNMGLVLYQLRSIPPYSGDLAGATLEVSSSFQMINPAGANLILQGILTDDRIEFNNSGVKLRILRDDNNTPANPSDDKFFVENPSPNPPIPSESLTFKIYRKPVRIESSAVRLPNNLFINLAFSGYSVDGTEFNLGIAPPIQSGTPDFKKIAVQVWFGSDGSVTRVFDRNLAEMVPATSPINLLMCSANRESADLTNLADTAFLLDDNSMWITIDNRTGGVTTGKMAQIKILDPNNPDYNPIREARLLARDRRSATP